MLHVMRVRRCPWVVAFVLTVVTLFSSCAQEVGLPADADPELRAGADVFRARCSSCHGADGGGAIGPSLREIESRLDDDAQRVVVVEGRKTMPAFGNSLSDADIDAVVRYTSEIL
jgi:mono/diheme cytochrome c family protein